MFKCLCLHMISAYPQKNVRATRKTPATHSAELNSPSTSFSRLKGKTAEIVTATAKIKNFLPISSDSKNGQVTLSVSFFTALKLTKIAVFGSRFKFFTLITRSFTLNGFTSRFQWYIIGFAKITPIFFKILQTKSGL